jgi:hypothetical protein
MGYAAVAWERAMTVQEVVLKALSGEIHWFRVSRMTDNIGLRSAAESNQGLIGR